MRGPITPRLDRLAAEGLRLNNFNVEFSCTVSRAALMTGRYAVRTGATQAGRHHAVGSDDRRSAAVDRLRHGPLRQMASRRRSPGESEPVAAGLRRVSTASRARATRRRRRSRRDRPRRIRRSSGRAEPDRRRATSSRSTWRRAAPSIANRRSRASRSWSAASATGSPSSSTTR